MENDIFKLQMHECLGFLPSSIDGTSTDYISIMRVPSGWIYSFWDSDNQQYSRSVFVPIPKEIFL